MHRSPEKIDIETIEIQGLPAQQPAALFSEEKTDRMLTLVHLSDVHSRHRRGLTAAVIQLQPDGVMITGDLFDGVQVPDPAFDLVRELRQADLEVFYVTGNHELYRQDTRELLNELRELGVRVLENEVLSWKGIQVAGISEDAWPEDVRLPDTDRFRLLLIHDPYKADRLPAGTASLILSGHMHGGQWRIGQQGLAGPGHRLFPKYTSGLYRTVKGDRLIVSRGLGDWMKIPRICNPWHLPVIHLRLPADTGDPADGNQEA